MTLNKVYFVIVSICTIGVFPLLLWLIKATQIRIGIDSLSDKLQTLNGKLELILMENTDESSRTSGS